MLRQVTLRSLIQNIHISRFNLPHISSQCFSSLPSHIALRMPALSPTMAEGSIASWSVAEGTAVSAGDAICEIETDKATVDFEVAEDGILAKILVPGKDKDPSLKPIKVGEIIGVMVEDEADVAAFKNVSIKDIDPASKDIKNPAEKKPAAAPIAQPQPQSTLDQPKTKSKANDLKKVPDSDRLFISPLAKRTAVDAHVNPSLLQGRGSGPNGRIIYQDVINFLNSSEASATVPTQKVPEKVSVSGDFIDMPIGEGEMSVVPSLAASFSASKKEIPHYFLTCDIDVTKIMELRSKFLAEQEVDLSVNDFIMKASALSMKAVPSVNASFHGEYIRFFKNCNINVFTSSPNKSTSLDLIERVNTKGLKELASESALISKKSKESGSMKLGTFSIINLGMYDIKAVHPIVLHGQSACLGVGAIEEEIIPISPENKTDDFELESKYKVTISASFDHRVVDGAVGAQWLQNFKNLLENPMSMLL